MRTNLPVTGNEVPLSDQFSIVSTTDLQGNITYANPYFVEISGYAVEDLIGSPQNILRHPSMPREAFEDLWNTIKAGESWTGVVKNRTKNGDHYWVLANVTPVYENGQAVGYMSVRTKPSRELVSATDRLYQEIVDGNPRNLKVIRGQAKSSTAILLERYSLLPQLWTCVALVLLSICALDWTALTTEGGGFKTWLLAASALGLLGIVRATYLMQTRILGPLKAVTKVGQIMAGGDLTQNIPQAPHDEVGELQNSMRQTNINLRSIIGDVRSNFDNLRMATQEIATGNLDLSNRTEAQASSLEETAASMEQITSTVAQSSANAGEANKLAHTASDMAEESGKVVQQMVTTMEGINISSRKIVDIIGLIDGIAFQTNILALNAAVEAARAGDQGRGFSVVAAEVRTLAQRSATAAKEIKQLIDASMINVTSGMALTGKAGGSMEHVISSVKKVSSIINEMTTATREQSTGIAEVNQAVGHLDTVTQQNAALVEQAAAAASNLAEQTDNLTSAIAIFKLPGDSSRSQTHSGLQLSR
jgi:aerotaxis receptor